MIHDTGQSPIIQQKVTHRVHDEPGRLSEILSILAETGANIMTINSIVPVNGTAVITISAETMDLTISLEELLARLSATRGVVKAEILAG